jgi:hypothetical protein
MRTIYMHDTKDYPQLYEVLVASHTRYLGDDGKTYTEHYCNATKFETYQHAFDTLCIFYKRLFGDSVAKTKRRLECGTCTIQLIEQRATELQEGNGVDTKLDDEYLDRDRRSKSNNYSLSKLLDNMEY